VVVTNFGSHDGTTVSVLKNASSPGTILFDSSVDFTVGDAPYGVAISDINNDNKADIVVTNFGNYDGTSVSVLENNGSSGNLSFKQKEDLTVGTAPHGIAIGYLNGDSLPDLAVANYGNSEGNGNTISVLLNQYNPSPVYLANFDATALPQGIQLSWQSAQENDLIGFNLYRAESQDGPQVQINTDLIPAINPGELRGNAYHYLDATTKVGKVYYYWVEWVGKSSSEFYGPVTASLAQYKLWLPLGLK
jgi:hypothetical protein